MLFYKANEIQELTSMSSSVIMSSFLDLRKCLCFRQASHLSCLPTATDSLLPSLRQSLFCAESKSSMLHQLMSICKVTGKKADNFQARNCSSGFCVTQTISISLFFQLYQLVLQKSCFFLQILLCLYILNVSVVTACVLPSQGYLWELGAQSTERQPGSPGEFVP